MSRTQRFALLGGAGVVLVVVLLVTRGGDDPAPAPQAAATTAATTSAAPAPAATITATTATVEKKPKPKPDPGPLLTADEVTTIKSRVGRTIRFRARSVDGDEVHVHGYDTSVEAPAGKVVTVAFEATMPGIFEVELENSGIAIGKLEVGE
jgi:hypothetical protein